MLLESLRTSSSATSSSGSDPTGYGATLARTAIPVSSPGRGRAADRTRQYYVAVRLARGSIPRSLMVPLQNSFHYIHSLVVGTLGSVAVVAAAVDVEESEGDSGDSEDSEDFQHRSLLSSCPAGSTPYGVVCRSRRRALVSRRAVSPLASAAASRCGSHTSASSYDLATVTVTFHCPSVAVYHPSEEVAESDGAFEPASLVVSPEESFGENVDWIVVVEDVVASFPTVLALHFVDNGASDGLASDDVAFGALAPYRPCCEWRGPSGRG